MALAGPAAAEEFRADAIIKVIGEPAVGNDVYDDGSTQQAGGDGVVGGKVKYIITAQNDGDKRDKLIVNAAPAIDEFSHKFKHAKKNVTSKVEGSGYRTPLLKTDEKHKIKLIVKNTVASPPKVEQASIEIDSLKDGDTETDIVVAGTEIN